MDTEENNHNEEFYDDSPLNSDEEADRIRKFRGKGRELIYKEEELTQKLEEMKSAFEEAILNKLRVQQRKKGVPWIEKLDATSDKFVELVSSDINDDIQREVAFYNIALDNTKKTLTRLKGMNQRLMRPNDYLVEMFKSDDVMQKIRNNLVKQQIKIQNFEEKKQNRENKKFARKLQQIKVQEKAKEKRKNLAAINKWKEAIKQRGDDAPDLEEFTKQQKNAGGKKKFPQRSGGDHKGKPGGRDFSKKFGNSGKGRSNKVGGKFSRGKGDGRKGPGIRKKISKLPRKGKMARTNQKKKAGSRKGRK